jgi:ABC-type metal ion transport system, periplasmic component/surface adhesin
MTPKRICILILALIAALALSGCGAKKDEAAANGESRPVIVCSLFPQYDFARSIAGEYASVSQLLPPGVDSHDYEPSVGDMVACDKADLFIYTDDELETWVKALKGGLTHVRTVRCAEGIDLEALHEEWEEKYETAHEHESESSHAHKYDAHIWLDPVLAIKMCENIRDALTELDRAHAEAYRENCASLVKELEDLDARFRAVFEAHPDAVLYFGGKFAYSHFIRRYGAKYYTAYDDCSDEGEPSLGQVVLIKKQMRENHAKYIFTDEMSSGLVAREIARDVGGQTLLFHTCHNLSADEQGKRFVDVMNENLDHILTALNGE